MCDCLCASSGDPACNPGMCPDWESNWQPFGLQARAQSTELYHAEPQYFHFSTTENAGCTQCLGLSFVSFIVLCFVSHQNVLGQKEKLGSGL